MSRQATPKPRTCLACFCTITSACPAMPFCVRGGWVVERSTERRTSSDRVGIRSSSLSTRAVACVRTAGIVGLVARKRAPTSAKTGGVYEPACGRRAGYTTRIDHGETVQMPKRFAGIPRDQRPLFFPSMMTMPHCSISPLRAERDGGSASSVGMTMRLILADGY
jgi:hypothetical protein